jgi:type I restriction enzyme R subunit
VEEPSPFPNLEELRRDAAATLVQAACAPFDDPNVREVLITTKQQTEITIDTVTADKVLSQGFDAAAKEKAQSLISTFKTYLAEHREEIAALSILYSRPYRQRLTETMLKELESKLRETDATWHEDTLWRAFETVTPERVRGKTQVDRFADLVPMVRFALEQQEMLEPFADSVKARFEKWMEQKESASGSGVSPLNEKEHESGVSPNSKDKSREGISADKRRDAASTFSAEQRAWLELIRDHIATTLSIEPEDFDYAPFSQQGGLGKAWQLFGEELAPLLDELNEVLAA